LKHRKIYFVSTSFPPLGRGGAIMRACFAKYLVEDGWDLNVITAEERNGFFLKWEYDYDFYYRLKIIMNIMLFPSPRFEVIGEMLTILKISSSTMINWVREVKNNMDEFVNADEGGIIFANYPDIANLYVGLEMKKRYNFPLVLDLRDDYSGKEVNAIIKESDIIFVTTETLKKKIIDTHNYNPNKVIAIYNGYADKIEISARRKKLDILKIIYAGTIAKHQKPEILNKAFRLLMEKHPELKGKIQVEVYGQKGYYYRYFYRKTLCEGISFNGFIPYLELMKKMMEDIDIGFFSLADDKYSYATPTKLFDYINLELPILAALPDGEAKDIIETHQVGKVAHYSNIEQLADHIYAYYIDKDERIIIKENIQKVKDKFHIRNQVLKMSKTLGESFGW